jgi:hypothetical protein
MTGTSSIFTRSDEIYGKFPLSRLATIFGCYTRDTFSGRNPYHQTVDPFAAKSLAFCSDPVGICVARADLRSSPKEAFCWAL